MKKGLHPEYRLVVFEDTSNGYMFLGKSTKETKDTVTFEEINMKGVSTNEKKVYTLNTD